MDFAKSRENMVESQLRTNKVTNEKILTAMREIAREKFVPTRLRDLAYIDKNIEITNGRFMMSPMDLARILQSCQIKDSDSILIIGSSTGYSAAVASKLASSIFAVEEDAELVTSSEALLTELAMDNVVVKNDKLFNGWKKQAPFDVIIFDGAVDFIPNDITEQMSENGRMVAVVKQNDLIGIATIFKKQNGHISNIKMFDANLENLNQFMREDVFVL